MLAAVALYSLTLLGFAFFGQKRFESSELEMDSVGPRLPVAFASLSTTCLHVPRRASEAAAPTLPQPAFMRGVPP